MEWELSAKIICTTQLDYYLQTLQQFVCKSTFHTNFIFESKIGSTLMNRRRIQSHIHHTISIPFIWPSSQSENTFLWHSSFWVCMFVCLFGDPCRMFFIIVVFVCRRHKRQKRMLILRTSQQWCHEFSVGLNRFAKRTVPTHLTAFFQHNKYARQPNSIETMAFSFLYKRLLLVSAINFKHLNRNSAGNVVCYLRFGLDLW